MLINQRKKLKEKFESGEIPRLVALGKRFPNNDVDPILSYIYAMRENAPDVTPPESFLLETYRKNRNSNSWRSSLLVEELCEYAIYLESNINIIKE